MMRCRRAFVAVVIGIAGLQMSAGSANPVAGAPWPAAIPEWTPSWAATGAFNSRFGVSVASAGDVNGDGYADVIIGARIHSGVRPYEGRAVLYSGSASGLRRDADWVASGSHDYATFGGWVSSAGDVNGDGYSDVIVGSRSYRGEAKAFAYYGTPEGLSRSPNWSSGPSDSDDTYDTAVAAAGDLNGDGYDDVLVGEPDYSDRVVYGGRILAYYGSSAGLDRTPAWILEGEEPGSLFGYAVAGAGDVNADGFSDLLVTTSHYDSGTDSRALLYLGSAAGPSKTPAWVAEANRPYEFFHLSAAGAGDVDGDGFDDVVLGAPGYEGPNGSGGILFYRGSPDGLEHAPSSVVNKAVPEGMFGWSVSTAGDINGDGYADVVVGEIQKSRIYVFSGSSRGLVAEPALTAGYAIGAFFGFSVAGAGDVNGDGYSDVIVGAPQSGALNGAAFLFNGFLENRAPTAKAGADAVVECASPGTTPVTLDGSESADPDSSPGTNDDVALFEWFEHYGTQHQVTLGAGPRIVAGLTFGSHTVTLRVTDWDGASDTDEWVVSVLDTIAPGISIEATPAILWPPNHRMMPIRVNLEVDDACDPSARALLSEVLSSDEDAGGDVAGAVFGTPDDTLFLRAVRTADRDRVYRLTYVARDGAGNMSAVATTVTVARSPR